MKCLKVFLFKPLAYHDARGPRLQRARPSIIKLSDACEHLHHAVLQHVFQVVVVVYIPSSNTRYIVGIKGVKVLHGGFITTMQSVNEFFFLVADEKTHALSLRL